MYLPVIRWVRNCQRFAFSDFYLINDWEVIYMERATLSVFVASSLFSVSQHLYTKSFSLGARQLMLFI